jgi:hypothetical protein
MKRKKKEVRPMERGYISGSELSLEIEQAEELLPTSCHWAVNLTEGIQHFGDSFSRTVSDLDDLRNKRLENGFDVKRAPKIRSVLRRIRNYCRRMAAEDQSTVSHGHH